MSQQEETALMEAYKAMSPEAKVMLLNVAEIYAERFPAPWDDLSQSTD